MADFIAWCGFLGGWCLVAGPIYQAALELDEEGFERERLAAVEADVDLSPPTSAWWWLLPPVKLILEKRRSSEFRRAFLQAMDPAEVEALVSFTNKAYGWVLVGFGGFLIAVKETYELTEAYEWGTVVFWALVILMGGISLALTVARMHRGKAMLRGEFGA